MRVLNKTFLTLAGGLLLMASSARADLFNINDAERGWVCTPFSPSPSSCPANNGAAPGNNYFVGLGSGGEKSRNWFEFSIPTLTGGPLVSATLLLDEGSVGHQGAGLTYSVYGLSGRPLVFTDVTTSNPFGSVGTSLASNGTTVAITLNAAALAAISADQGANIFVGGIDSGELSATFPAGDFAGTSSINKTVLSLQTSSAAVTEPSSLLLLGTGLLGLIGAARRKWLG